MFSLATTISIVALAVLVLFLLLALWLAKASGITSIRHAQLLIALVGIIRREAARQAVQGIERLARSEQFPPSKPEVRRSSEG